MEYDASTQQAAATPASDHHEVAAPQAGRGHLRIRCEKVDTKALAEPLILPFSGRKVMNRFLKAPMTERLCKWNKDGEDIVCILPTRAQSVVLTSTCTECARLSHKGVL